MSQAFCEKIPHVEDKAKAAYAKRIKEALEGASLSQVDLSRKSGLAEATVSRLLAGKTIPDRSTIEKVAKATGAPFRYLLLGETNEEPAFETEGDLFRSVPMNRGKIGAGPAMLEEDESDGRPYAFQKDFLKRFGGNQLRIFKVTDDPRLGSSMLPTISPGALLLADMGHPIAKYSFTEKDDGKVFVVRPDDDGLQCKRVFYAGPERMMLLSDNPETKPRTQIIDTSDFDPVRILIGRVRWVGQML